MLQIDEVFDKRAFYLISNIFSNVVLPFLTAFEQSSELYQL